MDTHITTLFHLSKENEFELFRCRHKVFIDPKSIKL